MPSIIKLGFFAALVGGIYWAYTEATKRVGFKVKGYGIPEPRSGWQFDLPIKIQFNNPSPVAIPVERIVVDVALWSGKAWDKVAHIDRSITIQPGSHVVEIKPTLQLKHALDNIIDAVINTASTRKVFLRTEVTATFAGFEFPTQEYQEEIKL